MLSNLVEKIFLGDKYKAKDKILEEYNKKGFCIVNFLYFASMSSNGLLKNNLEQNNYYNSLLKSDVLLPDGIALYLFLKKKYNIKVDNLNGTDFVPFFLQNLADWNIILYGADQNTLEKTKEKISVEYNLNIDSYQNGYSDFDFNKIENTENPKVMLIARGSPLQENWVAENIETIKKYNLLVMNVGGLFDFLAGKEKRAPYVFRKLKLEWLWRLISDPKKNYKKVLNSLILFKELIH